METIDYQEAGRRAYDCWMASYSNVPPGNDPALLRAEGQRERAMKQATDAIEAPAAARAQQRDDKAADVQQPSGQVSQAARRGRPDPHMTTTESFVPSPMTAQNKPAVAHVAEDMIKEGEVEPSKEPTVQQVQADIRNSKKLNEGEEGDVVATASAEHSDWANLSKSERKRWVDVAIAVISYMQTPKVNV